MFVMVLLALLVILAYPYILNAYLKAQKDVFIIESKEIYNKAEEKYYKKLNPLYSLNWISDNEFNLYLNDIKQNMNYKIEEEYDDKVEKAKEIIDTIFAISNLPFPLTVIKSFSFICLVSLSTFSKLTKTLCSFISIYSLFLFLFLQKQYITDYKQGIRLAWK